MYNPLVSVIVPVYKVERYLRECVDSIIGQTYTNLEIILVDDGSPDKCPTICDEYARRDNRVKVIHQENGGLAHARNVGVDNAQGECVTFIDSDDYVPCNFVEHLYKGLAECDAEISTASFFPFRGDNACKRSLESNPFVEIQEDEAIRHYCSINAEHSMPFISACNKLFRTDLVRGSSFPVEMSLGEDLLFCDDVLRKCNSICLIDQALYVYQQRNTGALTTRYYPDLFSWYVRHYEDVVETAGLFGQDLATNEQLLEIFAKYLVEAISSLASRKNRASWFAKTKQIGSACAHHLTRRCLPFMRIKFVYLNLIKHKLPVAITVYVRLAERRSRKKTK